MTIVAYSMMATSGLPSTRFLVPVRTCIMLYRVFVRNDDGSMTAYQAFADQTSRIVEDSAVHGEGTRLITTVSRDYSVPLAKWAIPVDYRDTTNVFAVPVGTVVSFAGAVAWAVCATVVGCVIWATGAAFSILPKVKTFFPER
jgi:hypothetical protein